MEKSETRVQLTPICLPKNRAERSFQNNDAIVTGFGLTKEGKYII
jgi:hypothetical protein